MLPNDRTTEYIYNTEKGGLFIYLFVCLFIYLFMCLCFYECDMNMVIC